jgi:hypothetical protein
VQSDAVVIAGVCGKVNGTLGAGDGAKAFCILGDLSK